MAQLPRCNCGQLPAAWWRDAETFARVKEQHGSLREIAQAHGGYASTYSKWARYHAGELRRPYEADRPADRRSPESPRVEITGDEALLVTEPGGAEDLGDIDGLLRRRGLDPAEWQVDRVTVNEWEALVGRDEDSGEAIVRTLRQLKVLLRRRLTMAVLFPARDVVRRAAPKPAKQRKSDLWAFFSCAQAPFHDEVACELACLWLARNRPRAWVDLGDLGDYPSVSRYRDNPAYFASVQECVDAAYAILARRCEASPGSRRYLLKGNHDDRLRTELLTRAERMHGLRPAARDGETVEPEALSLRRLLHLDTLAIEYVETPTSGNYEHAEISVSPGLVARHGWVTGANAAGKTAERLGTSVVVGHTHRQALTMVGQAREGRRHRLQACEVGCLCRIEGDGLGYTVNPDWQQGFATATVHPDGSFQLELAVIQAGALRWRDQVLSL